MKMNTALGWLRLIGFIEGISLLILLFVAMPLKYIWDMPAMVSIVGWAHGILFMAFLFSALQVYFLHRWPFTKLMLAGVASFVPFGTFWFDKRLAAEQAQVNR